MEQQINNISSILVLNIFPRDIFIPFLNFANPDERKIIPQENNVKEKIMPEKKIMAEEKCQGKMQERKCKRKILNIHQFAALNI